MSQNSLTKSLFEENLKFGAMPTHPLGTSTVFHAGVIGEGKRKVKPASKETEQTHKNSLKFVSVLFKICNEVTFFYLPTIYWGCFGDALGMLWGCFGDALGILWGCFGDALGMFWGCFGDALGMFWGCFGDALRMLWDASRCCGDALGTLWR